MKSNLLKITAALAFAAVMFPFLFSVDINTYGNISVLRILFCYAAAAAVFAAGTVLAKLSRRHKKLTVPVRIAGALFFFAGFLSLLIKGDGVSVFALGVLCVFAFFIGERYAYKNFADMFPLSAFAFYIVLTIGCYIFAYAAAGEEIRETALNIITGSFALEFILAALLTNQAGIFDKANMRAETKTSLPKGLSAYNAALVLGFTVIGLGLLIFREPLAWLLRQAVIILIKAIFYLSQLFNAQKMSIEPGEAGDIDPTGYTTGRFAYILEAVAVITIIVLIMVFRRHIFMAVKSFFLRLGALFSGRPEESEQPEFTDVFENCTTKERLRSKPDNIYAVRRKYDSETDPRRKLRYGYQIILLRIRAVNQRLTPADTTAAHIGRGAARFTEDKMTAAVSAYDAVRYGDETPSERQLEAVDELVREK